MGASRPPCPRRRASVYLPILLIGTVAATLACGGLLLVQSHSRASQIRAEAAIARANALSAIEIARARIAGDNAWRLKNVNGEWITNQPISPTDPSLGRYSVAVNNPFGALSRFDTDPVIITGTGTKGNASQTVSVTMLPGDRVPFTCLEASIAAGGSITLFGSDIDSSPASIISANGDVINHSPDAKINEPVQAGGIISGREYKKSTTNGITPRTFPEPETVFASYPTATPIAVGSLPAAAGSAAIQLCVLSPASNPFGPTNSRGIYSIDCYGGPLLIKNCRIVGTLLVTNCSRVTVTGAVVWEAAESNLPCLLADGPIELSYGNGSAEKLKEDGSGPDGTGVAMNFNPAGTPYPYPGGSTDNDKTDTPSSAISGLIYSSGDATILGRTNFHTLVVAGNLTIGNYKLAPFRDSTYYDDPPPGFYILRTILLPGTYR